MNNETDGSLLRNWLGNGLQVVINYIVNHFFHVFFFHYYKFPYIFCPVKLSLYQSMSFTFFIQFTPPSHCGESEKMAKWCLAACWIKLQH